MKISKREQQKQRGEALLARPCKVCGEHIGTKDTRQIVCSKECGYIGRRKEKIIVECGVCGKPVERYRDALLIRSVFACGDDCQRVLAGRAGNDHEKAARKAKDSWKKTKGDSRKVSSVRYRWWKKCSETSSATYCTAPVKDLWDTKCTTAVMGMNARLGGKARKVKCKKNWSSATLQAMSVLKARTNARLKTGWDARCVSAASTIAKRMID